LTGFFNGRLLYFISISSPNVVTLLVSFKSIDALIGVVLPAVPLKEKIKAAGSTVYAPVVTFPGADAPTKAAPWVLESAVGEKLVV